MTDTPSPGPAVAVDDVRSQLDDLVEGLQAPASGSREELTAANFPSLYVQLRPAIAHAATRFLSSPQDIEEVVQETFIRLFVALPEIKSEVDAATFARRVLTNLCIDRFRVGTRSEAMLAQAAPVDLGLVAADEPDPLITGENAAIVREALSRLSPLHRAALVKREIEEKPLQQIAEELGVPEQSIKHVLFRARRSLRRLLIGTSVDPSIPLSPGEVVTITRRPPASVHTGKAAVSSALAEMPEAERKVLQMYYDKEMEWRDIANQLGVGDRELRETHRQAVVHLYERIVPKLAIGPSLPVPSEVFLAAAGSEASAARILGLGIKPGAATAIDDIGLARSLGGVLRLMNEAAKVWSGRAAVVWLRSKNSFLDGARPIDVTLARGPQEALDALAAAAAGAFA